MYRLLEHNESILPTDEFWRHGGDMWVSCSSFPQSTIWKTGCLPVRRKIEDAKELGTTPNTGSPKLPTLEEFKHFATDYTGANDMDRAYLAGAADALSFVGRQLRAGA